MQPEERGCDRGLVGDAGRGAWPGGGGQSRAESHRVTTNSVGGNNRAEVARRDGARKWGLG